MWNMGFISGANEIPGIQIEYLGRNTVVSTTVTPTYSGDVTATYSSLSSGGHGTYFAVIQSRDAAGTTSNPFTSVTFNGNTATVIPRSYLTGGDYNASAIAILPNQAFTNECIVVTNVSATHEGQFNVYLYRAYSGTAIPSVVSLSDNNASPATTMVASSTGLGISNSSNFLIAVASLSNTTDAWAIQSSTDGTSANLTIDSSADTGTAEFTTVATATLPGSINDWTLSSSGPAIPSPSSGGMLGAIISFS